MTKPGRIPTDLTVDLGDELSPEDFVAAVRNFMGYVDEITNAQKGDAPGIGWTVKVREGSASVGVEPNRSAPPDQLAMIYEKARFGADALERGDLAGADLPEKAVGHLEKLSDLSARNKNGKGICMWVERKPVSIGANIAKTVRDHRGASYRDFGTIEGKLEGIQGAAGALKIKIKDLLYRGEIDCTVKEAMLEKVLGSFRKRVEIEGLIHYRPDGTPISIEVQEIDVFPGDDELPSADDVRGILADG